MAEGGMKLAAMGAIGFLLIQIAIDGKPGSLLGAIIDPANMIDNPNYGAGAGGTFGSSSTPTTGTLTLSQIKSYASQAGFSGQALPIAIAVAMAESGGQITVTSPLNSNGTVDRGLWQVNSVHTQYDPEQLLTPLYNAKAAYAISSNGTNWYPWTTYRNGEYLQYLAQAKAA